MKKRTILSNLFHAAGFAVFGVTVMLTQVAGFSAVSVVYFAGALVCWALAALVAFELRPGFMEANPVRSRRTRGRGGRQSLVRLPVLAGLSRGKAGFPAV